MNGAREGFDDRLPCGDLFLVKNVTLCLFFFLFIVNIFCLLFFTESFTMTLSTLVQVSTKSNGNTTTGAYLFP
jgi:hypothetical protein